MNDVQDARPLRCGFHWESPGEHQMEVHFCHEPDGYEGAIHICHCGERHETREAGAESSQKVYDEHNRQTYLRTKPPPGIMPKTIWDEQRILELVRAMHRYLHAGLPIPYDWAKELFQYCQACPVPPPASEGSTDTPIRLEGKAS